MKSVARHAALFLAVWMGLAVLAMGELCERCRERHSIMSIGTCVECRGTTSSGAFKLCRTCSRQLGQCERCRAALPAATTTVRIDEAQAGQTIQLTNNATFAISLAGNASTGYAWILVQQIGKAVEPLGEIAYIQDEADTPRVGAAGRFVATFRATRKGRSVLTFDYRRPWETNAAPEKTLAFTIRVR